MWKIKGEFYSFDKYHRFNICWRLNNLKEGLQYYNLSFDSPICLAWTTCGIILKSQRLVKKTLYY